MVSMYSLDIYDAEGRKLFEDVPAPGSLLHGGEQLYFLTDEPPRGWTISVYDVVDGAERRRQDLSTAASPSEAARA